MKPYMTKGGVQQFRPSVTEANQGLDNDQGFCLACGELAEGVEPDARRYKCLSCRAFKVYGFEELYLMGIVYIEE